MSKIILLLFLVGLISTSGISQTVVLHPVKDNTLFSESGTKSNGAGTELFIGQTGSNANFARRRALLQFNLSSIPAGAVITNASLSVTCIRIPPATDRVPNVITLHKAMAAWGEGTSNGGGNGAAATPGDATWTCRMANGIGGCTQSWVTTGGDYSATVSSTVTVDNIGAYTFISSPALVEDIKKWVDTPAVNFGWMLVGSETSAFSARGFTSKEGGPLATTLTVTYNAAPCSTNTWTGAVNTAWETAGNWSCGIVPDNTTHVVINSGTVTLNSNRSVKSITLSPSVNFRVATGFNLTVVN